MMDSAIPKGVYRHYKGRFYEVLGTARHSETEETFVVYKTLYGDQSSWIRPLDMFTESVVLDGKKVSRFEFCGTNHPSLEQSSNNQ